MKWSPLVHATPDTSVSIQRCTNAPRPTSISATTLPRDEVTAAVALSWQIATELT
jgi:hypothetical protein